MRATVKLPQEKILAESPITPKKSFPWGRVYLEFAAIGCDLKWAVSGLFKGWVLLTAVGTLSAAIVLQNPSNFKLVWAFVVEQGSRPSVPPITSDPLTGP